MVCLLTSLKTNKMFSKIRCVRKPDDGDHLIHKSFLHNFKANFLPYRWVLVTNILEVWTLGQPLVLCFHTHLFFSSLNLPNKKKKRKKKQSCTKQKSYIHKNNDHHKNTASGRIKSSHDFSLSFLLGQATSVGKGESSQLSNAPWLVHYKLVRYVHYKFNHSLNLLGSAIKCSLCRAL